MQWDEQCSAINVPSIFTAKETITIMNYDAILRTRGRVYWSATWKRLGPRHKGLEKCDMSNPVYIVFELFLTKSANFTKQKLLEITKLRTKPNTTSVLFISLPKWSIGDISVIVIRSRIFIFHTTRMARILRTLYPMCLFHKWFSNSFIFYTMPPGAPFTDIELINFGHGWIITCSVNCGMKLLIHSQTSTVVPLKFWNV